MEPFLHAQKAMTLYGAMNYGSAPIITQLAPTPSLEVGNEYSVRISRELRYKEKSRSAIGEVEGIIEGGKVKKK